MMNSTILQSRLLQGLLGVVWAMCFAGYCSASDTGGEVTPSISVGQIFDLIEGSDGLTLLDVQAALGTGLGVVDDPPGLLFKEEGARGFFLFAIKISAEPIVEQRVTAVYRIDSFGPPQITMLFKYNFASEKFDDLRSK